MYQNFVFQESSKSAKVGKSGGQENAEHEVGLSVSQSNNIRHFPEHTGSVLWHMFKCHIVLLSLELDLIISELMNHYTQSVQSVHGNLWGKSGSWTMLKENTIYTKVHDLVLRFVIKPYLSRKGYKGKYNLNDQHCPQQYTTSTKWGACFHVKLN